MSPSLWLEHWQHSETRWCLQANRWGQRPWVRAGFAQISRAGDGPAWYALMLLVLLDGWRGLLASCHMAAVGLLALLIYRLLKRGTRRERPFTSDRRIAPLTRALDRYSFPSGHTLHAVAFTCSASAWYPPLLWLLLPFCCAIAVSRVVLGLHYPSDVLAALLLGLTVGLGSIALLPVQG